MLKTEKLELTQFEKNDKPNWLLQYNSDMRKIDAYALSAASESRQDAGRIDDLESRMTQAEGIITFNKQVADTNYRDLNTKITENKNAADEAISRLDSEKITDDALTPLREDIETNRDSLNSIELLLNDNYLLSERKYILMPAVADYTTVVQDDAATFPSLARVNITAYPMQGGSLKTGSLVVVKGLVPLDSNVNADNYIISWVNKDAVTITEGEGLTTANISADILVFRNKNETVTKEMITTNYRLLVEVYNKADFKI